MHLDHPSAPGTAGRAAPSAQRGLVARLPTVRTFDFFHPDARRQLPGAHPAWEA